MKEFPTDLPTEEQVSEKKAAAACAQATRMGRYPGPQNPDYYGSERKLAIFHALLQMRPHLSPQDAAVAAEDVFTLLCIQKAPGQPA